MTSFLEYYQQNLEFSPASMYDKQDMLNWDGMMKDMGLDLPTIVEPTKAVAETGPIKAVAGGGLEKFMGNITSMLGIASSVFGGIDAMKNKSKVNKAREGAYQIYEEELDLLGQKRDISMDTYDLNYDIATTEAGTQIDTLKDYADTAYSKSGLVTSGDIDDNVDTKRKDVFSQLEKDKEKLVLSQEQADLAFTAGERTLKTNLQRTLEELEHIPTTFMEGFFG